MSEFQHYARFYDLLYADKPYREEAIYVQQLLQQYSQKIISVLDAGCGTGLHAAEFVEMGYKVTGLDRSAGMIGLALKRRAALDETRKARLEFVKDSLQSYRSAQPFDAITALFHVMSYQSTPDMLQAAIGSAAANLDKGGLFLFDFWYTPAVLAEPPSIRIKKFGDEVISATRTSYPHHDKNQSLVRVDFVLEINENKSGKVEKIEESHLMRHFKLDEMSEALKRGGFTMLSANSWMGTAPPTDDSWYACITARKN